MKESIKKTRRTPALEALNEAHRLAVSPFVFQALCAMTKGETARRWAWLRA